MIVQGINSSGIALPLLVDASGRVIVVGPSPSVINPLQRNTFFSNTNLPAGASNQTALTVTNGETWRIGSGAVRYDGVVAGVSLEVYGTDGVSIWMMYATYALVTTQWQVFEKTILLTSTQTVVVGVIGATAGDDVYASFNAERIG